MLTIEELGYFVYMNEQEREQQQVLNNTPDDIDSDIEDDTTNTDTE